MTTRVARSCAAALRPDSAPPWRAVPWRPRAERRRKTAGTAPSKNRGDIIPTMRRGQGDDLIRKATDAALEFTETLPAYVCQEMMTRYQGEGKPTRWSAIDIVTMNLVFENNKEDYRDITVNGKPKKSLEETAGPGPRANSARC